MVNEYTPKEFKNRQVLDASDLNRMENQIYELTEDTISDPTIDDIPEIIQEFRNIIDRDKEV